MDLGWSDIACLRPCQWEQPIRDQHPSHHHESNPYDYGNIGDGGGGGGGAGGGGGGGGSDGGGGGDDTKVSESGQAWSVVTQFSCQRPIYHRGATSLASIVINGNAMQSSVLSQDSPTFQSLLELHYF